MSLHSKLRQREKLFGMMISTTTWSGLLPILHEKRKLDYIVLELEHNHYDWGVVEQMLRMAKMIGLPAFVRVTDLVYHQISKVLDLGACGILLPRIESAEQLERVIQMMRLPPRGKKGVGGYDFQGGDFQKKIEQYNTEKLLWIQMESPQAIKELGKMLETKEVAGVIVGPYDLSVSLGIPAQLQHPLFQQSVREVIRVCGEFGVSCGMFMGGKEEISFWRQEGMNIIWSGTDLGCLLNGFSRLCETVDSVQ